MPLTVVLAVGVDSYLFGPQRAIWQSAGLFVTSAGSMREAIDQFRFGDFDLVLLGHSITEEDKERLTSFVRASGSRTPMVFLSSVSDDCDAFANSTLQSEQKELLASIGHLVVEKTRRRHGEYSNAKQSLS
jgi:DNA-binding response OmpR family regulator